MIPLKFVLSFPCFAVYFTNRDTVSENPVAQRHTFPVRPNCFPLLYLKMKQYLPSKEFSSTRIYFLVEVGTSPTHPRATNACLLPRAPHGVAPPQQVNTGSRSECRGQGISRLFRPSWMTAELTPSRTTQRHLGATALKIHAEAKVSYTGHKKR